MPESHGLMHRAIAQSAALSALLSVDAAREMTDYVLDGLGVTDTSGLLAVGPEQILEAQQRAINRLALATVAQPGRQRLGPFGPVLDGRTIATAPLDALRSGGARSVPLIAGANRDEWRYFGTRTGTPDETTIVERLADWLPEPESLWTFYRSRAETSEDAWIELQTDRLFRVPTIHLIEAWGSQSADLTYHYDFRWRPPGSDAGATHSREIPFVFDTFHHARGQMLGGRSPARSLIDFMQTSWIEFARSGAPTVASQSTWPPYGSARRSAVLDAEPSVVLDLDRDVRQIWDGVLKAG
jgi:para-nitrobenzyl esterase